MGMDVQIVGVKTTSGTVRRIREANAKVVADEDGLYASTRTICARMCVSTERGS